MLHIPVMRVKMIHHMSRHVRSPPSHSSFYPHATHRPSAPWEHSETTIDIPKWSGWRIERPISRRWMQMREITHAWEKGEKMIGEREEDEEEGERATTTATVDS